MALALLDKSLRPSFSIDSIVNEGRRDLSRRASAMTVGAEASQTHRSNRSYIASAMDTPMLTQEREFHLAHRWRDEQDEAALHELVSAYMRLVISIAGRFRNYGLPASDLVQEGNVGL